MDLCARPRAEEGSRRTAPAVGAGGQTRHGYELGKLIETESGGRLVFHLDSLYPLRYRLEERGWIKGAWVEKAGERRRRFYRLTPTGQPVLLRQRQTWDELVEAVRLVTRGEHA
jgi:PadR family transcriptional regulator, regulatory protein PadR